MHRGTRPALIPAAVPLRQSPWERSAFSVGLGTQVIGSISRPAVPFVSKAFTAAYLITFSCLLGC